MREGKGPFLWLAKEGSPFGYHELPRGGMCLSVFLFVRDAEGRVLLGKYADVDEWDDLAGLDASRRRAHGGGWTVPASHLKFGEDPRHAARRVAADILRMPTLEFGEPRVETDVNTPARFGHLKEHFDIWFFFTATSSGGDVACPPWYRELAFHDADALDPAAYARGHEDVVARWLAPRPGASS